MKDIIERLEDCAEREYFDRIQPDGKMKCSCGNLFDPESEGEILSDNPYTMPFCNKCAKEFFDRYSKKEI